MEIRDGLALKLLSTFKLPEGATRFRKGLAYSPDGCFLAGCSNAAIIIWDVQTGGVAKEIEFGVSADCLQLVWSLNGEKIATLLQIADTQAVHIYQVTSSITQLSSPVQPAVHVQLWAHNESFRMVVMTRERLAKVTMVNIFEISSTLIKVEPFTFQSGYDLRAFSPSTNQVSAIGKGNENDKLFILDIHNSKVLLQATMAHSMHHCFSPDGSLFVASARDCFIIWRYTSGHYTQWKKFKQTRLTFQFSSTSSSILGDAGPVLHIFHLDYSPATHSPGLVTATHSQQLDAFSLSGTYIATAHQNESTITITNLHSKNPSASQFIDTGLSILAVALTGNVLLVKGPEAVVAWLLTEEGVVGGIVNNRRANQNDSLWKKPLGSYTSFFARIIGQEDHGSGDNVTTFTVKDTAAALMHNGYTLCIYHTQTGEILGQDKEPKGKEYYLHRPHKKDDSNLYYHDSAGGNYGLLEGGWPVSQSALQRGWVKDPEGKHRLWLHPNWRSSTNQVDWLHNASTLRLKNSSQIVIVKF